MLKSKGLFISVILHIVLFIVLTWQFNQNHKKLNTASIKEKSIKSFLYKPLAIKQQNVFTSEEINHQQIEYNDKKTKPTKITEKNTKQKKSITPKPKTKITAKTTILSSQKKVTRQSLQAQIQNLNSASTQQPLRPITNPKQSTIKSIFNPTPTRVPESNTRSEFQQALDKKQATTHYGDGIAIRKNKNGTCSLTQDLSFAGVEGVKTIQYFSCGKSEFDKNFDNHMKKTMRKYK